MTKKHFEALAAALKAERKGPITDHVLDSAAQSVADVCARFNPNFDRNRFLAACGVEGE